MTRLQTISRGRVRNLRPFGTLLAGSARRLLPDFVERRDYGFQDGGCAIMAQALVIWSEGRLSPGSIVLETDPSRIQHVVAMDDDLLLDSDGLATTRDMILKMDRIEACPGCILVAGFDPARSPNIPWCPDESERLAAALRGMLPDAGVSPWRDDEFHQGNGGGATRS